ncbi:MULTISPECIES: diacylglycerol kinase family protein [Halomonadaceae]|uniref:diacylglycerol/lipid kinase family protein n=1 Tax=Halomonadaceae TaxID=28256 RepID=UPI0015993AF8|nr:MULTISPECIES: diacylglycerol kinase family protein [Halomonas]QJQ96538.1 diacylglycerol kinase family lipid kinase [Halomonas sp. PA5]
MRNWLIANAKAGEGKRGQAFWLEHLQAVGLSDLLVRDFSDAGWEKGVQAGDRLLVAGGDGSVSRIAALCVERSATLVVLPSGTANDFARNLGLPDDAESICRLAVSGQTAKVDVAWIDGHLFLNVAHIGLGTIPVREAFSEYKKRFGRFSYLAALMRKLWGQQGFHGRLTYDGEIIEGRWLSIAVASGAFYGGGQRIPNAAANDGQLDIVAVRPRSWARLLGAFVMLRLLGRVSKHSSTLVHVKASECQIELRSPKTLTADGDVIGKIEKATAVCRPAVLEVACEKIMHT